MIAWGALVLGRRTGDQARSAGHEVVVGTSRVHPGFFKLVGVDGCRGERSESEQRRHW